MLFRSVRAAPGWSIAPVPVTGLKTKPGTPEEWQLTAEPEQSPIAKFAVKLLQKPDVPPERPIPQPPIAAPVMPGAVPASVEALPPSSQSTVHPLRLAIWIGTGLVLSLLLFGVGPRWRPEAFAILGLSAVAVLGAESLWAIPFWLLAAVAIAVRALRSTRRVLRAVFG